MVDVILGLQWGDEGKGKIVDFFAKNYEVIARFQGGPNAGHTLYVGDKKIVLHQIPSGIFHENKINLIGAGVVLDAVTLKRNVIRFPHLVLTIKRIFLLANAPILFYQRIGLLIKPANYQKGRKKLVVR